MIDRPSDRSYTRQAVSLTSALILLVCYVAPISAEADQAFFDRSGAHTRLIVDGIPHIVLGVFDQVGFSNWDTKAMRGGMMRRFGTNTPFTGAQDTIQAYERYYAAARNLGFNTVMLTFVWGFFETSDGVFVETPDLNNPLFWHMKMAEQYDMKIIIRWFGSNIGASNNCTPDYIKENPAYQRIVNQPGAAVEAYCYNHTNIREKEERALKSLMRWLKRHDTNHTYIMIQVNNELQLLSQDRCHCPKCNDDFAEIERKSRYDVSTVKGMERFNQEIMRGYVQRLARAIHDAYPGFIAYVNVWPLARGGPDPFDERDRSGRQRIPDPYVIGWLEDCPDIAFVGPDIYHIGFKPGDRDRPKFLNKKYNRWFGEIFFPWYKVDYRAADGTMRKNVVFRAETGVIVNQNEKPYRDIFDLLGPEHNALGDCVYALTGSQTSNRFQGLLVKDFRWLKDQGFLGSFHRAYFTRNAFIGIRNAVSQIAAQQGTANLLTFTSGFDNQNDCSGEYKIGGLGVSIRDNKNHIGKIPARARGLIVKSGARDFTFIGVDYTATLKVNARAWNLKAESGHWTGDRWHAATGDLIHPVSLDRGSGHISITMPQDNVESRNYEGLQYCIRVYDAS